MQRFISLEEYVVGERDGHLAVTGPSLDRAAKIAEQLRTGQAKLGFVGQRQVLVVPVDLSKWTLAEVAKAIADVEEEEERGELSEMRREDKAALYAEMGRKVEAVQPSSNSALIPSCPVCYEKLVPPLQVFSCTNGHLICSSCKERTGERCSTCRVMGGGRATAMEEMIRQMMGTP